MEVHRCSLTTNGEIHVFLGDRDSFLWWNRNKKLKRFAHLVRAKRSLSNTILQGKAEAAVKGGILFHNVKVFFISTPLLWISGGG